MEGNPKAALIKYSLRPSNYLIIQTIQLLSGMYLTVPTFDLNTGESTSMGTGIIISTLFAIDFDLNYIFDFVKFST